MYIIYICIVVNNVNYRYLKISRTRSPRRKKVRKVEMFVQARTVYASFRYHSHLLIRSAFFAFLLCVLFSQSSVPFAIYRWYLSWYYKVDNGKTSLRKNQRRLREFRRVNAREIGVIFDVCEHDVIYIYSVCNNSNWSDIISQCFTTRFTSQLSFCLVQNFRILLFLILSAYRRFSDDLGQCPRAIGKPDEIFV